MLSRITMLRHITSSSHVGRSQFSRLSTSAQYTGAPAAVSNFIDGVSTTVPSSNQTLENVNPATGQVISTLPRSNASDVEAAVAAAQRAAPVVRAMPLAARAALLERVANIIESKHETFAMAESLDSGKPLALARNVDIARSISNLRFFAQFAQHQQQGYFPTDGHNLQAVNITERKPVGVVALVTPWNLPLYLLTWKVAPAIMCGNTLVAKPSEITPTTASMLAEAFLEAGAPPGLFNVVHGLGPEVGAPLIGHPQVKAVSFTGGTATGSEVAASAARRFAKASLELGGKNATVVFADKFTGENGAAALAATAKAVVRSAFLNSGQICLCGSRILVEESVMPQFQEALVKETLALRVGDPLQPDTDLGPLVSHAHRDKVASYVSLALEEGGQLLCGGAPPPSQPIASHAAESGTSASNTASPEGAYLMPTLIGGLDPVKSRAATEEIFGPVATLHTFRDENEAIALANATPYGLAASVWTNDLERAHRVGNAIDVGMVWVNTWLHRDLRTSFGGTKDSGVGREGGNYSLDFYSETKNMCLALGQKAPPMPGNMSRP